MHLSWSSLGWASASSAKESSLPYEAFTPAVVWQVIAMLPSLRSLDGVAVRGDERRAAAVALQQEAFVLDLMLANTCLLHKLVSIFTLLEGTYTGREK